MVVDALLDLAGIIKDRRKSSSDFSYTKQLLDAGLERCAKKFGEEAIETMIAALHQSDEDFRNEAADLLYHLLVLLEVRSLSIADVLSILQSRKNISGVAEKAARTK
ncbi:MAG: phosphoribosyl-ATP diphosphatase [Hyphomicrobium sp.]